MTVTYLDLKTGEKATESGISEFNLTQNIDRSTEGNICDGCERYIVIDISSDENEGELTELEKCRVISEANEEYYLKLKTEIIWKKK